MKNYSSIITLNKNSRGIYDFDTIKGCSSGMKHTKNGCYGECYAAKSAKIYGYNFNKSILRDFDNIKHLESILNQLENKDIEFIRMGVSGDPSENWKHTLKIIKLICYFKKPIVIITKHWNNLTLNQLNELTKLNVIINTSVSALDDIKILNNRLIQYNIIKDYCKSVLRIVSCDFNTQNLTGLFLNDLQNKLLLNENIIDTVFRISRNNLYFKNGIINAKNNKFMNSNVLSSKRNNKIFTGFCDKCPDKCGLN